MNTSGAVVVGVGVAGVVVAATVGSQIDGGGGEPPAATITITLAAASWDDRDRAARNGTYGSTRCGSWIALPGTVDRYVWCTQDDGTGRQCGYDPGDVEPALVGFTGVQVQLDAGIVEAVDVAAAYRAALSGMYTAGGSDAELVLSGGGLEVESVVVGGAFADRGTSGLWGSRGTAVASDGNPLNEGVGAHATSPAEDCVVTAIGVRLSGASATDPPDPAEPIRVALYVGGAAGTGGGAAFTGTALVADGLISADAAGYWRLALTPAQATLIPAGSSLWLLAKGICATTAPNYHALGSADSDLTAQNLIVLDTGDIDPDPDVAWPASLAGAGVSATFGVVLMMHVEYRTAPFVGDGSWAQTMGVHNDAVLAGSQSDLGVGGANVYMHFTTPPVADMYMGGARIAIGATHSQQMRLFTYIGGVFEDPDGATLLHDYGQTAGADTDAWVELAAPATRTDVPPSVSEWLGIRGNGGITVRFGANANPEVAGFSTAEPPDYPLSTGLGDGAEYEMSDDNPNHSTDETVAAEAVVITDATDFLPGNYPGLQLDYVADGDTVA